MLYKGLFATNHQCFFRLKLKLYNPQRYYKSFDECERRGLSFEIYNPRRYYKTRDPFQDNASKDIFTIHAVLIKRCASSTASKSSAVFTIYVGIIKHLPALGVLGADNAFTIHVVEIKRAKAKAIKSITCYSLQST